LFNQVCRRVLVKTYHGVNALESKQYQCASRFTLYGAGYSFESCDALVAVKAHDKEIAKRPGVFQILDMPRMDNVKTAVGKA
jgi:hypothetical protein